MELRCLEQQQIPPFVVAKFTTTADAVCWLPPVLADEILPPKKKNPRHEFFVTGALSLERVVAANHRVRLRRLIFTPVTFVGSHFSSEMGIRA